MLVKTFSPDGRRYFRRSHRGAGCHTCTGKPSISGRVLFQFCARGASHTDRERPGCCQSPWHHRCGGCRSARFQSSVVQVPALGGRPAGDDCGRGDRFRDGGTPADTALVRATAVVTRRSQFHSVYWAVEIHRIGVIGLIGKSGSSGIWGFIGFSSSSGTWTSLVIDVHR